MHSSKNVFVLTGMMVMALAVGANAGDLQDMTLPAPQMTGGKPLMQALKERQTSRAFSAQKLPPQVLADLLWAAAGINRTAAGKRTAPSAHNWQEVDVYVVMEQGVYLYDAKVNALKAVAAGDLRKATGGQEFVTTAPLNLVLAADLDKMKGVTAAEDQAMYMGADAAYISENIYLFCASAGLATVVRASVDRVGLAKALNLPATKKVVFAQTVGYPAAK
jgi:nitroreductase